MRYWRTMEGKAVTGALGVAILLGVTLFRAVSGSYARPTLRELLDPATLVVEGRLARTLREEGKPDRLVLAVDRTWEGSCADPCTIQVPGGRHEIAPGTRVLAIAAGDVPAVLPGELGLMHVEDFRRRRDGPTEGVMRTRSDWPLARLGIDDWAAGTGADLLVDRVDLAEVLVAYYAAPGA